MSRISNFGSKLAKPYVKAPVGVVDGLTVGNWIAQPNQKGLSRLAGYDGNGNAVLVSPCGKGRGRRTSMPAFRLAVGKNRTEVLGVTRVNTTNLTLDELFGQFV